MRSRTASVGAGDPPARSIGRADQAMTLGLLDRAAVRRAGRSDAKCAHGEAKRRRGCRSAPITAATGCSRVCPIRRVGTPFRAAHRRQAARAARFDGAPSFFSNRTSCHSASNSTVPATRPGAKGIPKSSIGLATSGPGGGVDRSGHEIPKVQRQQTRRDSP